MWPELLPDGSSGAASPRWASIRATGSCCSRSSTGRTSRGSRGPRSTSSPRISGSPARRSRRRSDGWWNTNSCWSMNLVGRVDLLATNWPDYRASCGRSTSPIDLSSWGAPTSPIIGHEGRNAYVGRSAAAVRALPCARLLRSPQEHSMTPTDLVMRTIGYRLRSPSPWGRRGGDEIDVTRKVTMTVWSPLRRLPASLAGMDQLREHPVERPSAGSQCGDPWRCPAQPRVQARAELAPTADDRVCAISLLLRLPSCRAGIQSPFVRLSRLVSFTASREARAADGRSTRRVSLHGSRGVPASTRGTSRRFDELEAS